MIKNLSIAKKIGGGFGVVLLLLGIVAIWAIYGISDIVMNAEEVIDGNMLRAEMIQLEVDHMNWANEVAALLTDDSVTRLDVPLNPHECGFGRWYYGERRQEAELLVPELKSTLERL